MAQVAITALGLDNLSTAHWAARAFFLTSLLAGCASVYYAMYQLRIFSQLLTARDVKRWLRGTPRGLKDSRNARPSAAAVLILDTPRGLVDMAAASFVCGLSIYVLFVFVNKLNVDAGKNDSRNIVIAYLISMWIIGTLYGRSSFFDFYASNMRTWEMLFLRRGLDISPAVRPASNVDPEHGSASNSPPSPPSTNETRSSGTNTLPTMAGQKNTRQEDAIAHNMANNVPPLQNSERLHIVGTGTESLYAALQDNIIARRKCLEADERLLSILEKSEAAPRQHS